jgi:O-antigen biosynthesis protein
LNTKPKIEANDKAQLSTDQAEIAQYQQEIARLQKALDEQTQDINKLIQWTQSLQQDILAVYNSVTWQMGNFMAQLILKLLRRPVGPTARDHINKILNNFEAWKINYFQNRRQSGLQPYSPWHETKEYALWIKQFDTLDKFAIEKMQHAMVEWESHPTISVLMVLDAQLNEQWLYESISSVQQQIYPQWELLIIAPAIKEKSPLAPLYKSGEFSDFLTDNRIQWVKYADDNTLATALNRALAMVQGEFVTLMGPQDQWPIHALYQIVEQLNVHSEIDLIYTDDDKLDHQGQRYDPYFKSDWNPDLFYAQYYIRHLAVYRHSVIEKIGGFRSDYEGCEEYDFTLRFIEQISEDRIYHIPQILYHQRMGERLPAGGGRGEGEISPSPTRIGEDLKQFSYNVTCQALQAHFQRLKKPVKVVEAIGGHTRVIYPIPAKSPLISLIIPTRDRLKLLRGTVDGILNKTDYQNLEIIIMDNGSEETETLAYLEEIQKDTNVSVIRHAAPFNYSQLNNIGVSHAKGELIGLINNDLEVISSEWLTEMVSHATRPEIGAVGAKLYYANNTIQHAGVIVGLGGLAGHGFKFLAKEAPGYHWHSFLIQNYSAVTAACLVMRRQIFEEVGGLEEKHLKVAFNDVDLCLRIRERGYRIVWTPYAELYHLESVSRGSDNTPRKYLRLRHELNYMKKRWGKVIANDPYYNPNLTIEYEDFALAYPPRIV